MSNVVSLRRGDYEPPVNYDAEKAFLGAVITNNGVFHLVDGYLRPEHFADPLHGRIYAACSDLISDGKRADPITLKRVFDSDLALQAIPEYRDRGGGAYIIHLAQCVVTVINADDYAREVVDLYLRRQVMDAARVFEAEAAIPDLKVNASNIIEGLEARLALIADSATAQRSVVTAGDAAAEAMADIERALRSPDHITGLPTGIGDLDYRFGGLQPGLIILGGRPSMGKSSLLFNWLWRAAMPRDDGTPSGAFLASLEMDRAKVGKKLIALETGIATDRQDRGQLNEDEVRAVLAAVKRIEKLDMEIDDQPGQTIAGIQSRARRFSRKMVQRGGKLAIVGLDYLQLAQPNIGSRSENRVQELSQMTRGLAGMWKALDAPVVALSQLSRALEAREDKRPQMADLRESGTIEQDADAIMFCYRDEYYLSRTMPQKRESEGQDKFRDRMDHWEAAIAHSRNVCELIIAKNRMGKAPMMVETYFNGEAGSFTNLRRGEIQ
nr:DnaB-like helicase C-terminal domain-containing protein [uncultured Dongia sp.]